MLSQVAPLPAATAPFEVVLINFYELGRQPFALAGPAALLKREGFAVTCLDLSLQKLNPDILKNAGLVALYVGMHTATRIAVEALPHIRRLAPNAHVCVYGLYAPMNEALLHGLGVGSVLGGEMELALVSLGQRLRANGTVVSPPPGRPKEGSLPLGGTARSAKGAPIFQSEPVINLGRIPFEVPDRSGLPKLSRYAHLVLPDGSTRVAGFDAFPEVTFDATIKIQHLIDHAKLLPELRRSGCLFITSAVEAVDDDILRLLAKNHTSRDFDRAVALTREAGIALAPTFVAFTPWTRLEGYIALLERLLELQLVESVPPVQLTIRLLVPEGSYLLKLPGFKEQLMAFDPRLLGYPWNHPDPRVDQLQRDLQALVARCEQQRLPRREVFAAVWRVAHKAAQQPAPNLAGNLGSPIPRLSEPWYCCAEPTDQQLQSF
jgi:hypothetical protein